MAVNTRQALHWVLKIGDRKATVDFLRNVLGMKVLRHEEFEAGCDADCNGPYDGKWSKTMIGYGPEKTHFVFELVYNYGIGSYDYRSDYRGVTINSKQVADRVKNEHWSPDTVDGVMRLLSPDGYPFFLQQNSENSVTLTDPHPTSDPVSHISLSVTNMSDSIKFWVDVLGMKVVQSDGKRTVLTYSIDNDLNYEKPASQCKLELVQVALPTIEHGTASGRVAFACPQNQLAGIEQRVNKSGGRGKVLMPLISLDTPGKATVQVVILADPDGYEICFVGGEAFWTLSRVDPEAARKLDEAVARDDSSAWYEKEGLEKPAAKLSSH